MTQTTDGEPARRADAHRNRNRILAAARTRLLAGDATLALNDLAREVGVGVGTVYRHFPNRRALQEALAVDPLGQLIEAIRAAAELTDPGEAFDALIRSALTLQLAETGLAEVLMSQDDATPDVRARKAEIWSTALGLLERAQAGGVVRAGITMDDVERLVCGVEYAVRLIPGDRSAAGRLYLDVLLAGLRPPATVRPSTAADR